MTSNSMYVRKENFLDHRVLAVSFSENFSESCHQIFFKPHKVPNNNNNDKNKPEGNEKPNLRTLFLSNIPPWATPNSLRRLFQVNGAIENVILQKVPTSGVPPNQTQTLLFSSPDTRVGFGFKYAYIVFDRPSGVKNAMQKMDVSKPKFLSTLSNSIETGLNKWRSEYNESIALNLEKLSEEIEKSVSEIDERKVKEKAKAESNFEEENADQDGWITVSRHTTRKPVGKISGKAQAKVKARENRKRKRKELENFYKHQMKEKKLRRMTELKEKFEADKQKQLKMKQERKFKPL